MFPALFVLHLQNFTKSVFFKTCLFHSSADVALLFSGFQALWGEWGLIFVRVVVFQRQVKTLHGCPFLWNINTLLLPGRSLRAFVYRTSFPGLVRADVFITTPRGGRNITTCKTHHVGLQSPTCVYLLVLFFFDGGDRGLSATISRNLRMKKKAWVRKGERAPAGLSFHKAGQPKDGLFLIRCRAPGTGSSSCVSQPFTSVNFKHIFTLFGSSSWQRS